VTLDLLLGIIAQIKKTKIIIGNKGIDNTRTPTIIKKLISIIKRIKMM
jgi:hypothetical protein